MRKTKPMLRDGRVVTLAEGELAAAAAGASSGPSDANRSVERHELPGNVGGFWISYDVPT